jgi:transcriptional regulator with XRE-family HTH domain
MSTLADRILELLDAEGISGNEMARRMNTSSSRVSQITRGTLPKADFLEDLANAFPDTDMRYILTGKGMLKRSLVERNVSVTENREDIDEKPENTPKKETSLPEELRRLSNVLDRIEKKL